MELFKANNQWSNRPADERFESLAELHEATKKYALESKEKRVPFSDLRVENMNGEVQLVGKAGIPAKLTHWAFGQLAARVGAPASYLRELPATLAAQNLNHGLAQRIAEKANEKMANLMFHENGGLMLRSVLTDDYARIWNYEVAERLLDLEATQNWKPAKPTMHWGADTVGTCIICNGTGKNGEDNCDKCKGTGREFPALYASDHDMFAFLTNSDLTVEEKGSDGALYKGIIVENSEVGASALKMTKFLFRELCGNHIIWGASQVVDLKIRHVGNARGRWNSYFAAVRRYAEESVNDLEVKIASSKVTLIGSTKEEVLDALFGKRGLGLSRKAIDAAYDAVKPDQDGDPNTVWGFVQGLTRYSQTTEHADKRTELDRAAGKVLEAFSF